MKITYCIPSKNNLRYLKSCIHSIQENSSIDYDIIVYIDSDDDGTSIWLKENNIKFIKNESSIPKGICVAYNNCMKLADTDVVCTFHADMYMAKGFDTGILKYLKKKSVVSATRIEPPLHPIGKEKIVKNFGMYPEDFKKDEFDSYVKDLLVTNKDVTTNGIFAPWCIYKEDIVSIGMHDEALHSFYEDSDIFNRFILNGYDIIQSWESYVYHLTCRGGRFQEGVEHETTEQRFYKVQNNAYAYYLRKWRSWVKNDEYQHPILSPKYNVGLIAYNCNLELLKTLEPWFENIYIENDNIKKEYISITSPDGKYDLNERIKNIRDQKENDILVEINLQNFNQYDFQVVQNLSDIIHETNEIGQFEYDKYKITIKSLKTYENDLIVNKNLGE